MSVRTFAITTSRNISHNIASGLYEGNISVSIEMMGWWCANYATRNRMEQFG